MITIYQSYEDDAMKIVCDFCERIINECSKEKSDWTILQFGSQKYRLCKKCSDYMWDLLEEKCNQKRGTKQE